ncbi:MAG: DUF4234 domain-containing protein [Armatimonadota bacterium]|nr:DUF4234 domain-containing protein [Armatimonadota bacterium]
MQLGTRRDPALVLVLILLTCGLYYFYFIYKVSQETQDFLGEPDVSPGVDVLLSLVTCGLWNIYWDYKMGKRMAQMCTRVGLPVTDNALLYLVLDLLGFGGFASLGLVNPILQQDTLNRIWQAAMTGPPPSSAPEIWPPAPTPTPRQPRPPQP